MSRVVRCHASRPVVRRRRSVLDSRSARRYGRRREPSGTISQVPALRWTIAPADAEIPRRDLRRVHARTRRRPRAPGSGLQRVAAGHRPRRAPQGRRVSVRVVFDRRPGAHRRTAIPGRRGTVRWCGDSALAGLKTGHRGWSRGCASKDVAVLPEARAGDDAERRRYQGHGSAGTDRVSRARRRRPRAAAGTHRRHPVVSSGAPKGGVRGCSSVAELQLPKLIARVRFPSPAPV
jgi:hypothetical protein